MKSLSQTDMGVRREAHSPGARESRCHPGLLLQLPSASADPLIFASTQHRGMIGPQILPPVPHCVNWESPTPWNHHFSISKNGNKNCVSGTRGTGSHLRPEPWALLKEGGRLHCCASAWPTVGPQYIFIDGGATKRLTWWMGHRGMEAPEGPWGPVSQAQ